MTLEKLPIEKRLDEATARFPFVKEEGTLLPHAIYRMKFDGNTLYVDLTVDTMEEVSIEKSLAEPTVSLCVGINTGVGKAIFHFWLCQNLRHTEAINIVENVAFSVHCLLELAKLQGFTRFIKDSATLVCPMTGLSYIELPPLLEKQ